MCLVVMRRRCGVRLPAPVLCTHSFNNLCLKYVEVSFYNVARSLTIVFNVMFSQLILGEQTSRKVMGCLVVVCLGFYLGTEGEVNFSLIGTLFGVSASCFVSLNSIYTKRVSGAVQNNKWKLAAYNNINACILFVPLMILQGEVRVILASWDIFTTMNFWFLMTVGGVFGFMIGIMSILQIQVRVPCDMGVGVSIADVGCGAASGDVSVDAQHQWHSQGRCTIHPGAVHLRQPHHRRQPGWHCHRARRFAGVLLHPP